jgi:hypothetical protein
VTQGGTSERTIQAILKHVVIVPVPTLKAASDMLRDGSLDAYATNKSVLFELSDALPGSRVLAGRWGLEHLAIGCPKGREAAAMFLEEFCTDIRGGGFLAKAAGKNVRCAEARSTCMAARNGLPATISSVLAISAEKTEANARRFANVLTAAIVPAIDGVSRAA